MSKRIRIKRTSRRSKPSDRPADVSQQRLQKVLASAGLGSRRQCEELITAGRVEVDGQAVTELGTKVDPSQQVIQVDGTPLPRPKLQYFAVNKPVGVVTTNRDPAGRPRVIDLIQTADRVFPVGRLDVSSEGLILVTNDGELTNLLAHPRYGVQKVYQVLVAGSPEPEVLNRLRQGVHLAEGFAHVTRVTVRKQQQSSSILEMVLDEGRNREIRRLLARVGHKVLRLKRIALGPLRLAGLKPGEFRPLRKDEVRELRHAALSASKGAKSKIADDVAKPGDATADNDWNSQTEPLDDAGMTAKSTVRKGFRRPKPTQHAKPTNRSPMRPATGKAAARSGRVSQEKRPAPVIARKGFRPGGENMGVPAPSRRIIGEGYEIVSGPPAAAETQPRRPMKGRTGGAGRVGAQRPVGKSRPKPGGPPRGAKAGRPAGSGANSKKSTPLAGKGRRGASRPGTGGRKGKNR